MIELLLFIRDNWIWFAIAVGAFAWSLFPPIKDNNDWEGGVE